MKYAIYMRYHRAYVSDKPQSTAGLVLPEFWRIEESGNREKINKAQTIKGNRQRQAGSLVTYQCGEIAADVLGEGRWYYPENEMPGEAVQKTGL